MGRFHAISFSWVVVWKTHRSLKKNKTYLITCPLIFAQGHIGGTESIVISLYNRLKQSAYYTPLILVSSWDKPKQKGDFDNNFDCIYSRLRTPLDAENSMWYSLFSFAAHLPTSLFSIYRALKKNRVEIINIQSDIAEAYLFCLLKRLRLFKGKLIVSVHTFCLITFGIEITQPSDAFRKKVVEFVFSSSDSIITVSESLKNELIKLFPKYKNKMITVHNGIDKNRFIKENDPLFKLPEKLKNTIMITQVGSFSRFKGNELLIKSFLRIQHKLPNLRLVLIGHDYGDFKRIKNLIIENGLTEKVFTFVNLANNKIPTFLSASRIFLLPSNSEGLPIAILEAAAYKLPIIATAVGGIPEVIKHNESGILIEKGNVEQLTDAIVFMLENPDIAKRMGESLYNSLDNFSISKTCEAYLSIAST